MRAGERDPAHRVVGALTRLRQVIAIDCMWFAWAAFYPQTLIFPGDDFQVVPSPGGVDGLW